MSKASSESQILEMTENKQKTHNDSYPDRICQGQSDSQWKAFGDSHDKYSHTNDKELDKFLEVFGRPWKFVNDKRVN